MTDHAAIDLVKRAKAAAAILAKYPSEVHFGAQLYDELAAAVEALRERVAELEAINIDAYEQFQLAVQRAIDGETKAEAAEAYTTELAVALNNTAKFIEDLRGADPAVHACRLEAEKARTALASTPAAALKRARAKDNVIRLAQSLVWDDTTYSFSELEKALAKLDALDQGDGT